MDTVAFATDVSSVAVNLRPSTVPPLAGETLMLYAPEVYTLFSPIFATIGRVIVRTLSVVE